MMMQTGSIIGAVVGGRLVSLPFSILFSDGTLIALLATVTAGIVAASLVTAILIATLATGATLWLRAGP